MIRIFSLLLITILLGFSFAISSPENRSRFHTYPEHLTGAFTGGFGEETCRSCHFDYDLNPGGGSLSVSGIGDKVSAGQRLEIQIVVEREDLGRAGFQLSARYPDGSRAGQFKVERNERLMFTEAVPDSLQYVQHSSIGTEPLESSKNRWTVFWLAPQSPGNTVIFNVAANAANGDQSEFGDFIYKKEIKMDMK